MVTINFITVTATLLVTAAVGMACYFTGYHFGWQDAGGEPLGNDMADGTMAMKPDDDE